MIIDKEQDKDELSDWPRRSLVRLRDGTHHER